MATGVDQDVCLFVIAHDALVLEAVEVNGDFLLVTIVAVDFFQHPGEIAHLDFVVHPRGRQLATVGGCFFQCEVVVAHDDIGLGVYIRVHAVLLCQLRLPAARRTGRSC